jgi:UDP-glucose 4-epimerase
VGIFLRQFDAREPLTIVGDGLQRRDFTYVNDVVEANILAANTNNEDVFGQIFNIGVGSNHSILDLAKMIGYNFKQLPERLGEARVTLANIDKASEFLGWKPEMQIEDWIALQKLSGIKMSPKQWIKKHL